MSEKPFAFKLIRPTTQIENWPEQEEAWRRLNADVHGNPALDALEIKGAYVIGVIHDQCKSISCLLESLRPEVSLFPAFGLFSASVELLGRCINGSPNHASSRRDLTAGFEELAPTKAGPVSTTALGTYTVDDLVQLRHFSAHGQAMWRADDRMPVLDPELPQPMSNLLASALERFWASLHEAEDACNRLAQANVLPVRNWPVGNSWLLFSRQSDGRYSSVGEIFSRFVWKPGQFTN